MSAPKHEGTIVRLGGREWILADLAPRQYRKVIPAILKIGAFRSLGELDEAKLDLMLEAFQTALTRNYPELTLDQFLDMPVTVMEMVEAFPILAERAGLIRRAEAGAGEALAGTSASTSASTS